jgi:hypothetical protein
MAKLVFQNTAVVAAEVENLQIGGFDRRKQHLQITDNSRDGVLIVGGIVVWDDDIERLSLTPGTQLEELDCRAVSRMSKDGRWYWEVTAYKAVRPGQSQAPSASVQPKSEGGDPF